MSPYHSYYCDYFGAPFATDDISKTYRKRFGFGDDDFAPDGIWIHAVSVGEVGAAVPLVEHILARHPNTPIVITTMTPTGADRVRQAFGERVRHAYLPYDYPGAVARFLRRLRPRIALVMETEIWPNLIHGCHRRGVPMWYVNVRLSARAHRGYRRAKKLIAPALDKISGFAAQGKMDARRLIKLGAPANKVRVTGNLKFDITPPDDIAEAARAIRKNWGEARPVWLAGSTHDGEEEKILDAFAKLRRAHPTLLLIIAPRHPQRFAAVHRLCQRRQFQTTLRSKSPPEIPFETDIHIADSMGELPLLIAAADLAFIGGSLVPTGGHNLLEASAVGVPVVFGPHTFNFTEIADLIQTTRRRACK